MNECIDVSPILANLIVLLYPFTNKDINIDSKSIHISNGLYKNTNSFSLIKLNTIESIEIGNDCFLKVNTFKIESFEIIEDRKEFIYHTES